MENQGKDIQQSTAADQELEIEEHTETPLDRLKPSHKRFVLEYLENGYNAVQAAIKSGYSKHSSFVIGTQLMARPDIRAAVEWGMAQQGLTRPIVKGQIADIILNSDIAKFIQPYQWTDPQGKVHHEWKLDLLDENGQLRPGTHLIQQVSVDKEGKTTLKMYSRLDALDKAAKALQLYSDGSSITNNLGFVSQDIIANARAYIEDYERQKRAARRVVDISHDDGQQALPEPHNDTESRTEAPTEDDEEGAF